MRPQQELEQLERLQALMCECTAVLICGGSHGPLCWAGSSREVGAIVLASTPAMDA